MRSSSHSSRKRRRAFLKSLPSGDIALQITSMADVFTILLVFLLKNLAAGDSSLTVSQQLLLPEAVAGDQLAESIKLEITPQAVSLEDKQVSELRNFSFFSTEVESNGTIRPLNSAFISAAKNRKPSSTDSPDSQPKLLVLADEHTPYSTLKAVLDTAASNGYSEFKLVVVEDR